MERRTIARALRAVRRRKGWSQRQLGARIGISRSELSRWETSWLDRCSVEEVERWASALGAHLVLDLRVDGERPMSDARHAILQNWLATLLRAAGWTVEVEVSFNHYGDRGRIDLLAFHATIEVVLVIEIKTMLADAQDVLGRLDVKVRVAPIVARERGWDLATVVPALVILDGSTARRRVVANSALFASLDLRARGALAWLGEPRRSPVPGGILLFVSPR
jgi:DNA-binding XRE family transcriptional regulator